MGFSLAYDTHSKFIELWAGSLFSDPADRWTKKQSQKHNLGVGGLEKISQ